MTEVAVQANIDTCYKAFKFIRVNV